MTVREQLQTAIREATERDDRRRLCTLRLIQTAIRDRDQAHCIGNGEKISQNEIASLLQKMIKQREEQIAADRETGNAESVVRTQREVVTIREFMPPLMDDTSMQTACAQVVKEIGAAGLRDVGRTITALKKRYPGQLDLGRASGVVKGMLR
ncbi:GatB/YqeY domain-containing protein [Acuticoccus sp. M5D2P5]|uniref:GatB/YqeY domain-containing protein n=1 Tax=Acuticoccus kalidii TaxID=2910977 RepID=UPI001F248317|nr:GatB/YqeY domain-containing protein [Acuticoccus kalidii]MCF3936569.1 GatB/YqeY domain-containing protein [Acuticoccus kalidii]